MRGGPRIKPVVVASINDEMMARCIDVLRVGDVFAWVECRRDPEDNHGWRRLSPPHGGFDSAGDALDDARARVGWM